jgi:hypothetical protein
MFQIYDAILHGFYTASTFYRPNGVRDLGRPSEGGEINFSLGTGLTGLIFVWEEEDFAWSLTGHGRFQNLTWE